MKDDLMIYFISVLVAVFVVASLMDLVFKEATKETLELVVAKCMQDNEEKTLKEAKVMCEALVKDIK